MKRTLSFLLVFFLFGVNSLRGDDRTIPDCWTDRASDLKGLYEVHATIKAGRQLLNLFMFSSRNPYGGEAYLRALTFPKWSGNAVKTQENPNPSPKYIWKVQAYDWGKQKLDEGKLRVKAEEWLDTLFTQVRSSRHDSLMIKCASEPARPELLMTHVERSRPEIVPDKVSGIVKDVPEACWDGNKRAVFRIWKRGDRPTQQLVEFFHRFFVFDAVTANVKILSFPFNWIKEHDGKLIRFSIEVGNTPEVRKSFAKLVERLNLKIYCANKDLPDEIK